MGQAIPFNNYFSSSPDRAVVDIILKEFSSDAVIGPRFKTPNRQLADALRVTPLSTIKHSTTDKQTEIMSYIYSKFKFKIFAFIN